MTQSNQQPGPLPPAWQVFIHGEDSTTSYIVHARTRLLAVARAGQEHDEDDRIEGVDVEPWESS